ncbi:hypothetical protein Tco_1520433 [Tanacetum coccineum]
MAMNFNVQEYESMEKLVVIAVSSCWVRRYNGLQLSGTSATQWHIPRIGRHKDNPEHRQPAIRRSGARKIWKLVPSSCST